MTNTQQSDNVLAEWMQQALNVADADQAGRPDWLPRLHAIHAELMQLYSQVCAEANEQEAEHHAAITTNTR